jgi:hypothetical protein
LSGGLRYAATTGYYLTALRAEIRFWGLRSASGSDTKVIGGVLFDTRFSRRR